MTHENVSDARDDLNHRTLLIELDERAGENRTIEASLSSELPVPRGEYNEILVHEPSAVNMERADSDMTSKTQSVLLRMSGYL